MLLLTATHDTNGQIAGDYDCCVEGELVYLQEPCATGHKTIDTCGCGRGFAGANSHRATTTAKVTRSALAPADVREALRASLHQGGWLDPQIVPPREVQDLLDEILDTVSTIASHFGEGSVVRRNVWQFSGAVVT